MTVNKVCLSGLDAIALAGQLIRAGEFDIVVAGGMESMTSRAALAQKNGILAEEIIPVLVPQRGASPAELCQDEGIRADTTRYALAGLRTAFTPDGTITAGSSSPISYGAAAVVVASKDKAVELGLSWIAEIGAHGNVAGRDNSLLGHPIGMSGVRLVLTLSLELQRRGGGIGAAALCGGGGQGEALVIDANDAGRLTRGLPLVR